MDKCLFCKIVAREIPAAIVYEDAHALAFLDIHPESPGHTLVIPKQHYRWVWDITDIGRFYETVQKVALAQRKAFGTDWIISKVIGEEIPHAHVWLVPAKEGAPLPRSYTYVDSEAVTTAEKIHAAIS